LAVEKSSEVDEWELSVELGGELSVSGLVVEDLSVSQYFADPELGRGEPSFDLGCGPVDSAELDGALFDLVEDLGLCSPERSKSGNRGVVGALVWSAAFVKPSSHRFCDAAVPSSATSTALTCTSCTSCTLRTTTGAARAELMIKRIRKTRAKVMYRRILVGLVTRYRRRCRSK